MAKKRTDRVNRTEHRVDPQTTDETVYDEQTGEEVQEAVPPTAAVRPIGEPPTLIPGTGVPPSGSPGPSTVRDPADPLPPNAENTLVGGTPGVATPPSRPEDAVATTPRRDIDMRTSHFGGTSGAILLGIILVLALILLAMWLF